MKLSAELESEFADTRWFHSIDFGDVASSGRFKPGSPQNITLFGFMDLIADIDLSGQSVLDIGAVDGLASFGMKALGAAEALATDSVDKITFRRGRELLGLDIGYHPNTQIKDLTKIFKPGRFDLILCAGVFYHMLNPASAFFECRKIIKDGGLLVMESPYFKDEERAAIFVNSETEMVPEAYTYSIPTKAALVGLMKLAGFDVLAIRTISSPDRITVLGRAVAPESVSGRTTLLKRIHEVDFCDFEFRLKDHLPPPSKSQIVFSGQQGEKKIDYKTYVPKFPYHPDISKRTVGSTLWSTPTGNR
ncbi:MAG: DUF1698 domain-containing protein [Parvibaculum sp.]|uniref:class I SAM-dependent methyltransferase n=1 Tax=Parvibaculum sp. TaxID=2024848 RepID=UPI0025CF40E2|nr:DUF1698 domain-containing protein [Parvibaculum sp.]MCE9650913.1 DUF1698 domain-containing protein [Parvibaculum sp.]